MCPCSTLGKPGCDPVSQSRRIAVFDVSGMMAHFRRIDTNSTSLTYRFPPRTTLAGMIGALLGLDIDDTVTLAPDRTRLTVSVRAPGHTSMQTLVTLKAKKAISELKKQERRLVGTELVVGEPGRPLQYRIYAEFADFSLGAKLEEAIRTQRPAYPLALGLASCLATAHWVNWAEAQSDTDTNQHNLVCPCPVTAIEEVLCNRVVARDLVPWAFRPGRTDPVAIPVAYCLDGPLSGRFSAPVTRLHYQDEDKEIREEVLFGEDCQSLPCSL